MYLLYIVYYPLHIDKKMNDKSFLMIIILLVENLVSFDYSN